MRKIVSLFAAVLFAFAANAATTDVAPGKNALKTAVAAASAGDVLVLADGIYYEEGNFDMTKNLTIKAAEGAKPVIANRYYFKVEGGADITFQGLKFDGASWRDGDAEPLGASDYCMRSYSNSTGEEDVTFVDCEFTGYPSYIFYTQRTNRKWNSITIRGCFFHNNARSAVYITNESGTGQSCNALTIENSTFANVSGSYDVIYYSAPAEEHTTTLSVDHCTFYGHPKRAIYWQLSENLSVSNCIFAQPASVTYKSVECVSGTISNCLSYNSAGYSSAATATNNVVEDPLFKDATNNDFTLGEGSPALTMNDGQPIGDPRWAPAAPALLEAPDAAPAAPTWPANQVKAVYSATYEADCNFGEWSSGTAYTQDTYGKKYVTTNSGYFGLEFKEHLNCSKMEKLHLDIWVAADASMRIVPIWGGAEQGITKNLTGQQWNSVEIALSEFNQVTNWADVYQIKIDNAKNLTFWLNNVYFYTTQAPAVDETAPADVKAVVESASYFSVKIKASATDASDAVKLTVKNGEAEVASINAVSGADAILTVNNLKPNTDYNFSVIASDESGNTAEPVAVAAKTIVAPAADAAPKTYKGLVKSIYSDKYAAAPASIGTLVAGWWEPTELSQGEIAQGDNALFYAPKATGMFGWEFAETDMTGFPYLHISIYPLADGKIKIFPVVNGSTDDYVNIPDVKGGEWNHLVFDFSGKDLTKVFQIGWQDYYTLNGFFVDNVYFSQEKEEVAGADRRINAYGLNVVADGDNYTFSYIANIDGTEANLIFYQDGVEKGTVAIAAPVKGQNQASVAKSDIPNGINTWAVELKAGQVYEFTPVFEDTENVLNRAHAVIDNSPESDYMGRIYIENRAGSKSGGVYVYNADYTINAKNTKCGLEVFRSAGRPAVAADGTLWLADWGDGGTDPGFGVASVDPATLTATKFYNGNQASNGLWTNAEGIEMGSSCAGVGLLGEGKDMKLYAMNEDGTLPNHGCLVYNIGQPDGTILKTWDKAPDAAWTLKDNAAQNLELTPCSHGVFFSCNRSEGQNTSGARALQLVKDGEQIFVGTPGEDGTMPQLTGCAGGGFALTRDEDHAYIVNGAGNILSYNVTWTGDVPTMEFVETLTTSFNAIGTLKLDYAGNLIASAGSAYGTSMRLVVYAIPTANNEIIVPAKKALVVAGANQGTAIEDVTVQPVQKFFRDGQIYIIRDGVVYTITGNVVR